ncbi:hypothetical protein DYH10_03460 [Candidatus Saccharibacteria bacterium CPR2]|nr:hypothetical protein [Candidatus Saccharibacteria bacterium CPR2]
MKSKRIRYSALLLAVLLVVAQLVFITDKGEAAATTSKSDILSRLKTSTAANHEIKFVTPSGVDAGETITLTFDAGFSMGSVAFGDIDLAEDSDNDCTNGGFSDKTLAATPSGATWGAAISGQVLTFTSGTGTITADRCVQVEIGTNASGGSNQITNPGTGGTKEVNIGGTFGDTGDIAVVILSDDQVVVTATVDESMTFSISDNTIEFGTLSASDDFFADDSGGNATEVEAHNLVAGTNASGGYGITINGSTLTAGAYTIDAIGASNTASATGTEQYGIRMTASGGSGTVSTPYAAAGFALDTGSFPDQVASSTGASANTTYSVRYLANIASNTEAGAYSATMTYVATAIF